MVNDLKFIRDRQNSVSTFYRYVGLRALRQPNEYFGYYAGTKLVASASIAGVIGTFVAAFAGLGSPQNLANRVGRGATS